MNRAADTDVVWREYVFGVAVLAAMVGCVAVAVVDLVHVFFPTWAGAYLVAACVLAALEAGVSHRIVRARAPYGLNILRFRLAELAMFFVLLKAGRYVGVHWSVAAAEARMWWHDPLSFFDPQTLVGFFLVFFAWDTVSSALRDLEVCAGRQRAPLTASTAPGGFDETRGILDLLDAGEAQGVERLLGRFFLAGAVLLLITGITRVGMMEILDLNRAPVSGLVLNVLVYFGLGLVLVGHARYSMLRADWRRQEIKVGRELSTRWAGYSVVFLAVAALVAFVLPTAYTAGPLELIGMLLEWVFWVLLILLTVFFAIVDWLLYLLLGHGLTGGPRPLPETPRPAPPAEAGPAWLVWLVQLASSLLFWTVLGLVVGYVVWSYLEDRPELMQALSRSGVMRALLRIWNGLRQTLGWWGDALRRRGARRRPVKGAVPAAVAAGRAALFRLGALSPRAQVMYYYRSLVRRAGQGGVARRPAQTPYEYQVALGASLPEVSPETAALTEAFVEARYSAHAVEKDHAQRARAVWEKVRAVLRRVTRERGAGSSRTRVGP